MSFEVVFRRRNIINRSRCGITMMQRNANVIAEPRRTEAMLFVHAKGQREGLKHFSGLCVFGDGNK
jgi:hypothetical protein